MAAGKEEVNPNRGYKDEFGIRLSQETAMFLYIPWEAIASLGCFVTLVRVDSETLTLGDFTNLAVNRCFY